MHYPSPPLFFIHYCIVKSDEAKAAYFSRGSIFAPLHIFANSAARAWTPNSVMFQGERYRFTVEVNIEVIMLRWSASYGKISSKERAYREPPYLETFFVRIIRKNCTPSHLEGLTRIFDTILRSEEIVCSKCLERNLTISH